MAAIICDVAGKTYDAGYIDMTAMTGGSFADLESDWLYMNNVSQFNNLYTAIRKIEGARRIIPQLFAAGADPLPTVANGAGLGIANFTADVDDRTSGTFSTNSGLAVTAPSSQINCGEKFVFALTRKKQTFQWLGHVRNGGWEAKVEFSDASASDTFTLPTGALNTYVPGWFEAFFRGTGDQVAAGVTATVSITRVNTGISATGNIYNRALVLLVPEPAPRPRGWRSGR